MREQGGLVQVGHLQTQSFAVAVVVERLGAVGEVGLVGNQASIRPRPQVQRNDLAHTPTTGPVTRP